MTNLLSTNWQAAFSRYRIIDDQLAERYEMYVPYFQTSTPMFFKLIRH